MSFRFQIDLFVLKPYCGFTPGPQPLRVGVRPASAAERSEGPNVDSGERCVKVILQVSPGPRSPWVIPGVRSTRGSRSQTWGMRFASFPFRRKSKPRKFPCSLFFQVFQVPKRYECPFLQHAPVHLGHHDQPSLLVCCSSVLLGGLRQLQRLRWVSGGIVKRWPALYGGYQDAEGSHIHGIQKVRLPCPRTGMRPSSSADTSAAHRWRGNINLTQSGCIDKEGRVIHLILK